MRVGCLCRWALLMMLIVSWSFWYHDVWAQSLADRLSVAPPARAQMTGVDNRLPFAASVRVDDPGIAAQVPDKSVVRLKCMDPASRIGDKFPYYTLKRKEDGSFIFVPDSINPDDPNTLFTFLSYLSGDLVDYFGITHVNADKKVLCMDMDERAVYWGSRVQEFSENEKSLWRLSGDNISSCFLKGLGGHLYTYRGKKNVKDGKDVRKEALDVWGIRGVMQRRAVIKKGEPLRYGQNIVLASNADGQSAISGWFVDRNNIKSKQPIRYGDIVGFQDLSSFRYMSGHRRDWRIDWMSHYLGAELFIVLDSAGGNPGYAEVKLGGKLALGCCSGSRGCFVKLHGHRLYHSRRLDAHAVLCPYSAERPEGASWPVGRACDMSGNMVWVDGLIERYEDVVGSAKIYKIGEKEVEVPGNVSQIAVNKSDNAWGVTQDNQLLHWNGKVWEPKAPGEKIRFVSISPSGKEIWCIRVDGRVVRRMLVREGFEPTEDAGTPFAQISVRTSTDVWGINSKNQIMRFNGQTWNRVAFPGKVPKCLSMNEDGSVWVSDEEGTLWLYKRDLNTWTTVDRPSDGAMLTLLSSKSDDNVWGISTKRELYFWNGSVWTKRPGIFDYVCVANGFDVTLAPRVTRDVVLPTTVDLQGNPAPANDAARISIEMVQRGAGGGIKAGSTFVMSPIPLVKKPRFLGFTSEQGKFRGVTSLGVLPLRSLGMVWFDKAVGLGRGAIRAKVYAGSKGGVQFVAGKDNNSNDFVVRADIGGGGNRWGDIIQRKYIDGVPENISVYRVLADTCPDASVPSGGKDVYYWASMSGDLFVVGGGKEISKDVFMACRIPELASARYWGVATDEQPVRFEEVSLLETPVRTEAPARVFALYPTVLPNFLLRAPDVGCISFSVTGGEAVDVVLAKKTGKTAFHFVVSFDRESITVKKWFKNKYEDCFQIKNIGLDAKGKRSFWVGYEFGTFMIGQGRMGSKMLFLYKDADPLVDYDPEKKLTSDHAQEVMNILADDENYFRNLRYLSFEVKGGAQVQDIQIADAIDFKIDRRRDRGSVRDSEGDSFYTGDPTLIRPCEYLLWQQVRDGQLAPEIMLRDVDEGVDRKVAMVKRRGALYNFKLVVDPKNPMKFPALEWSDEPEDVFAQQIERDLIEKRAAAELKQFELEQIRKEGDLRGQELKADAASMTATSAQLAAAGQQLVDAGSKVIDKGPVGMVVGGAAAGAGIGMIAGSFATGAAATGLERQSAQASIDAQREAMRGDVRVQQMKADADKTQQLLDRGVLGKMEVDPRWLDKGPTQQKRMTDLDLRAAREKENSLNTELSQAMLLAAQFAAGVDAVRFSEFMTSCESMLSCVTSRMVVANEKTRKQLWTCMTTLHTAGKKIPGEPSDKILVLNRVIQILFDAYNNYNLVDEGNSVEAMMKNFWLDYIYELFDDVCELSDRVVQEGQDQGKFKGLEISGLRGEYVFYPKKLPADGNCCIEFEVRGYGALFCLSHDKARVRGSGREVYEVGLGGVNNDELCINFESLANRPVMRVKKSQHENVAMSTHEFINYWINYWQGHLTVGIGKPGSNVIASCYDPYPNKKRVLQYFGLSTLTRAQKFWIRNINISPALQLTVEGAERAPESEIEAKESVPAPVEEVSDAQIEKIAEGEIPIAPSVDEAQAGIPAASEELTTSAEDPIARAIRIQRSRIIPERMLPDVPAGEGIMVGADG